MTWSTGYGKNDVSTAFRINSNYGSWALPCGTGGRAVCRRRRAAATSGRVKRVRLCNSNGDGATRVRISRRNRSVGGITAWVGEGRSRIAGAEWVAATVGLTTAVDSVIAQSQAAWRRVRQKVRGRRGERPSYGEGRQSRNGQLERSGHGLSVMAAVS
jgi:hypothetical protein